tara:strand:- start:687 stop:809 length:123 start_codon:yes stop_codon:yes gene_type:complete
MFKNLRLSFGRCLIDTGTDKASMETEFEDCGGEFRDTTEC